ncbi:MAG: hypothetical protein PHW73_12435 [Atribacterota bacterium]|nr:hypothetical protein [Atribacterota bacterium]
MVEKIKAILSDKITKTALWIGVSAGLMAIVTYLLNVPELLPYYGILNFVLYALKEVNDRRKV